MWVTSSLTTVLTPTAVALGNFDGLHQGHRQVVLPILTGSESPESPQHLSQSPNKILHPPIDPTAAREWHQSSENFPLTKNPESGKEKRSQKKGGNKNLMSWEQLERAYTTVVTFNPHPQEFFTGQSKKLLTPHPEKVALLTAMGIQQFVLLPFDQQLASLTPAQFVETILVRHLQVRQISIGADFRFGRERTGGAQELQALAAHYGVHVNIVPLYHLHGERISSSVIRQSLQQGNIEQANQCLGRSYSLSGQVVRGQQLGRTLGFPTANLALPPEKFLPRFGVYAVRVFLAENPETAKLHPPTPTSPLAEPQPPLLGVMNIGCRPTVEGQHPTVEVHLLDWWGDLYGKTLAVSLEKFLRPEQKFPSLDSLKVQIQADCIAARTFLLSQSC